MLVAGHAPPLPSQLPAMSNRRRTTLALPFLLLATACAGPGVDESRSSAPPPAKDAAAEEADPAELKAAEQKVTVAKGKLEIARLELEAFEAEHAIDLNHAQEEIDIAKAILADFEGVKAPARRASAELSMQGARDAAEEAHEELEQLAIMYDEQELHDMTKEFVIQRGKRRAVRADKRLSIQETELESLLEHELPLEQRKLKIALQKSEESLAELRRKGEIGRRGKQLGLIEAEAAVERAERELEKTREGEE